MRPFRLAGGLLTLCFASTALHAQAADPAGAPVQQADVQPAASSDSADQATVDDNKWKFATIAYGWFAGAHGETDVIGPVPPVGLDLSFGDVLKGFKFAFMGAAEARKDRFVVLGDLTFIHLEAKDGIGIRDPDFLEAELDSRTAEITLVGGYRVVNSDSAKLDLLAGGRMNFFKTTLQLDGPNRSAEGSKSEQWLDPLIAARAIVPFGEKWSWTTYGDLGGIAFGSDITWQIFSTVNYQISRKMTLGGGWRTYKVNYDHGDFLYDVAQNGPVLVFRTDF